MARSFYTLLQLAQSNPAARQKCEEHLYNMCKEVEELVKDDENNESEGENDSESIATANSGKQGSKNAEVNDPTKRVVTKGKPRKGNVRIRSFFEKRKTATSRPNEYGTFTPVARLF